MERQKTQGALGVLFERAAFGLAILGRDGTVLDSNAAFRAVYGNSSGSLLSAHDAEFTQLLRGERDLFEFEHEIATARGQTAWAQCSISRLEGEGDAEQVAICICRDLTDLKQSQQRALHEMTHDPLTGLPNRLMFESKLRERLRSLTAEESFSIAVLVADLDHFREINEGFGHDAADFVLSQIGQRMRKAVGAHDLVARIGTDQFAIMVDSLKDVRHVETTARRLFSAFAKPLHIGAQELYVSASVGIAMGSRSDRRPEDIMRDAQIATRYAKARGGSRTAIFDEEMHALALKRLQLSTELPAGLERDEMFLVYQPIVELESDEFIGCEALLRWRHPLRGVVLPAEFVPLAEQIGLTARIGRVVSRLACRQLAAWREEHAVEIDLNFNVAWPDLLEAEFEQSLIAVTREFEVNPAQVTLEITENVVLNPDGRATPLIDRLRRRGFRICIDDFGTGYSSLHYLQRFPIDAMKIDRSFVCGPDGEVASEPIVRALLTLADGFGVKVVAEGIETQKQCKTLRAAGCRYGQGFYFSTPLTADELAAKYPSAFGARKKTRSKA